MFVCGGSRLDKDLGRCFTHSPVFLLLRLKLQDPSEHGLKLAFLMFQLLDHIFLLLARRVV